MFLIYLHVYSIHRSWFKFSSIKGVYSYRNSSLNMEIYTNILPLLLFKIGNPIYIIILSLYLLVKAADELIDTINRVNTSIPLNIILFHF